MSWKIEHRPSENIVRITAEGIITAEDAFAQAIEGVQLIVSLKASGVLVDYSGATLEMPLTDIYKLPDMFDAGGLPHWTKIAIVLPADPQNMHKYTFFDDTATNRGFQVKLYWERSQALAWLTKGRRRRHAELPQQDVN
ncbi:MAG TPA: STAS/SEC14 domain-containing protein [Gammaproteobacteria bacterium]|nr:STAS/SEC14 domain-containing protein [Gammaproteobacteria bacterium]